MRAIISLLIFLVFPFFIFSQTIEELKRNVEEQKNAASWNALGAYHSKDADTVACRTCAEKAYVLAVGENNDKEIGYALMLLSESHMYKSEWEEYIQMNEKAAHHYILSGEIELQLEALGNIGYAYNTMGEYDKAISVFEKALDVIYENKIEGNYLGVMLINTAFAYLHKAEISSTKEYIDKALIAAEAARDTIVLIEGNSQLGIIYKREGNYQKALEHYEKSLYLYELSGDYKKLCTVWINIATLYYDWGKFDKALEMGRKALQIAHEHSLEKSLTGQILSGLGTYLIKTGDYSAGLDTLKIAAPYLTENKYQTFILYLALSTAFEYTNQVDSSELYLQKAEEMLAQNKNFPAVRLYKNKGTLLFRKGMYNEAIPVLEKYVKEYSDNPSRIHLSDSYIVYSILSEAYELGPKDYERALNYKKLAYEKRDSLYKEEHTNTINEFYARYETAEKELEISKLNEEKQEARFQTALIVSIATILGILFLIAFLYNRIKRIKKEKEAILLTAKIEQKETEYKILLSETEQHMIRKYLEGKESERKSLAKELHDSVANDIVSVLMLYENGTEEERVSKMLKNTYNHIRQISHQLMPPEFKYISLIGMIEDTVEILNKATSTRYFINMTDPEIPSVLEEMDDHQMKELYYIIQEVLGNIRKHANAENAEIMLLLNDGKLIFSIRDDGRGFDMRTANSGIGLRTMKDRAAEIKAELHIESDIGKGTVVTIIPSHLTN